MKKSLTPPLFTLLFMSMVLSSCSAIAGIFKAGMSFGIFIAVFVVLVIIVIVIKSSKK